MIRARSARFACRAAGATGEAPTGFARAAAWHDDCCRSGGGQRVQRRSIIVGLVLLTTMLSATLSAPRPARAQLGDRGACVICGLGVGYEPNVGRARSR